VVGYFVAGLWWLGAAFLVDADWFLGGLGLTGVVELFTALVSSVGLGLSVWLRDMFARRPWNLFGVALPATSFSRRPPPSMAYVV
jgi:apolipoprotein N-acyltransferase